MSMIEQELEDLEEAGAAWNLKWDDEHQVCFYGQKKMEHTEQFGAQACPLQGAQGSCSVFRVYQVDVSHIGLLRYSGYSFQELPRYTWDHQAKVK